MSGNGTQPTYPPELFNTYTIAFEGSSIACILYGVYLAITGMNLSLVRKKRYNILMTYSIVQLVITTLYFAISLYAAPAQSLAIFNIVGTYGPNALSPWPMVVVNVAFVLNTWASDGFLLYRCYVVCMSHKLALMCPVLLYVLTLGASIAWLVVGSTPGAMYSTYSVQIAGICYWSCSAAMNVCASFLISVRFWVHRRAITRAFGTKRGTFYIGYMAMTLESALLYTMFVIVALIVFVTNSPLENVFFPVLGTVQAIAPALIIYRIARGMSLETDEYGTGLTASASLRFSVSGPTRPVARAVQDFFDGSGTVHASSGESVKSVKMERDDSNSFIQHVKEDSEV